MKKTIFYSFIAAAALLGLASCKKDDLGKVDDDAKQPFTITAEIEDNSTKVTYEVDNTNNKIAPKWTAKDEEKAGDKIFGFDSEGETFTFTVTAVDGEGKATLTAEGEYAPAAGTTLYAIYYPGKDATYFEGDGASRTLAVDLSSQTGASLGDASPVLMCATATVDDNNNVKFIFSNQTAIVGIKKFKIGANETVTSVKASGLVTSGTFEVVDGELVLTPGTKTSDIAVNTYESSLTSGDDGIVGDGITPALMFATLPTTNASISLSATTSETGEYVTLTNLTGKIAAGGYYYGTKKLDRVAEVTIGGVATIYGTLADAVAAANAATSAATIKMLKDVTLDADLEFTNVNEESNMPIVTLDLNGNNIETTNNKRMEVTGKMILTDNSTSTNADQGCISAATSSTTQNVLVNAGKLIVQGGRIVANSGDDGSTALYCQNGGIVVMKGGLVSGGGFDGAILISSSKSMTSKEEKSSFEMSGGSVESTSKYSTIYVYRSDAEISGGSIINNYTNKDDGYALYISNSNNATEIKGNVSITNTAEIECEGRYGIYTNATPVTISGGRVESRYPFYATSANCSVSGGSLINSQTGYSVFYSNAAEIQVSGGSLFAKGSSNLTGVKSGTEGTIVFSKDVVANKIFINSRVADGYINDVNDDKTYIYKLISGDNEVTIGSSYHSTFAAAVQYANSATTATTLKLAKNIDLTKSYELENTSKKITLSLSAYKISCSDLNSSLIQISSEVEINSSDDGGIENNKQLANARPLSVSSSGKLTVNGGKYIGYANLGIVYCVGNCAISNATVISKRAAGGTPVYVPSTAGEITVEINSGDFLSYNTKDSSAGAVINNSASATVEIKDGHFHNNTSTKDVVQNTAGGTCTITGGYFGKYLPDTINIGSGYEKNNISENPEKHEIDGAEYTFNCSVTATNVD